MISVCVPYWDRQAALDRMFENFARVYPMLEWGKDIEFSVCDDGSPVPARVPVAPGVTITRLPAKRVPLNPCVPINMAVAASTGDVVVISNPEIGHTEPTLLAMLALLQHEDDYVVARCWDDRGFWIAHETVRFDRQGRAPVPPGGQFHFCAMMHRSLWNKAGGFDEEYRRVHGHDDNDWLFRLHAVGATFLVAPSTVQHPHTTGLKWNLPSGRRLLREKWGV